MLCAMAFCVARRGHLSACDTSNDLADDFEAVITSMAARLYGRRHVKRRAAPIQACVRQCVERAEQVEQT